MRSDIHCNYLLPPAVIVPHRARFPPHLPRVLLLLLLLLLLSQRAAVVVAIAYAAVVIPLLAGRYPASRRSSPHFPPVIIPGGFLRYDGCL
jgi:hypothetical protein